MPKTLTAHQRLDQAKALIRKAREVPEPPGLGYRDLTFVAQVKDLLRQARDLIKFLQYSPGLDVKTRNDFTSTMAEIEQAEKEILQRKSES